MTAMSASAPAFPISLSLSYKSKYTKCLREIKAEDSVSAPY